MQENNLLTKLRPARGTLIKSINGIKNIFKQNTRVTMSISAYLFFNLKRVFIGFVTGVVPKTRREI